MHFSVIQLQRSVDVVRTQERQNNFRIVNLTARKFASFAGISVSQKLRSLPNQIFNRLN